MLNSIKKQVGGIALLDSKFFCFAGGTVFDASQYAFFGKNVVEEVELGGLEDGDDRLPGVDLNEEEFFYNINKEEVCFHPCKNFNCCKFTVAIIFLM